MRATRIISFLSLVLVSFYHVQLHADITIRYDQVLQNLKKRPVYSASIKNSLIRLNQLQGQQSSILVNLDNGDIAQVHGPSKRYFKTTAQTLNQYASFYKNNRTLVQGLIDQGMSQLDPQNRDQVQQILKSLQKGNAAASNFSVQQTQSVQQVLGVSCKVLAIFDGEQRVRDICLASYQQLELSPADIKSLERLRSSVEEFKPSAPKEYQDLMSSISTGMNQLSGVPLKITQYSPDGKIHNMVQAGSISVRNINTETFLIPAEYEEQMYPVL